ncbi:MAG: hypothetical protein A3B11_01545 [Candidatus Taylorbacteria bacterium RIFCSPLOWO2_01_FULL_44_26]|uniref:Ribulose-phosphate 3-epimerase n=2 Tax=Candidatus Tayloriibacteriota TaxID=1817919 RepID=A0A1G2MJI8_9BACT|nr:MAG: hypothetical protein A3D50_01540 [Candidatus Taylorbacteria bacterium RIFCSPHIGHO2_02_FULL_44_12]OHA31283.1 MAG: hypothetical protein A3B11_01545 [Candidatus Taylorbacteria bacterium RIFCSPLOWO2_01_FULL_44_26]
MKILLTFADIKLIRFKFTPAEATISFIDRTPDETKIMSKKIEIIPAILPKDFAELEEKTGLLDGLVKTVQIDVCDGSFTPKASWPYRKNDDYFEKITSEEQGMPCWETLNYEFDLMVNNPEKVVEQWLIAGATRIAIHAEAKGDITKTITSLVGCVEIGLALNVDTPLGTIVGFKDNIQFLQCMGIEDIGFQGQKFDTRVINRIKRLREMFSDLIISVDGGVSFENAQELISAGADRLVIGSAIWNSDNIVEMIRKFQRLVRVA